MATSVYPATGGFTGLTEGATFIPELWSDEIRAAYEKRLVMANLVRKIDFVGKKGDTMHIPAPTRATANAKAENTAVTVQGNTESEVQVVINKHYEISRVIEDIVSLQAKDSYRRFFTQDAGYGLAVQVDSDLWGLGKTLGDGTTTWVHSNSYYIDASTGLTLYAEDQVVDGDAFTDAGFRALIQKMDDADVPMDGRVLACPPTLRNSLMGIDRYMSTDYNSKGGAVQKGWIGEVYGIDVYVSSNAPIAETAAANSAGTKDLQVAMMFHEDTFILAEQLRTRVQVQKKLEFLGDLIVADTLYGVKAYRPDSGFVLISNK